MPLRMSVTNAETGETVVMDMTPEEEAEFLARRVVVPYEVAGWRGRCVMELHGLQDEILAAIEAIPDPQQRIIARVGYTSADAFLRDGPLLNTILTALGKTQQEIDGYFIEAAALPN